MDLAPDNGKTVFIYSALEIIDRIFSVLDVFIGTILYTVKLSIVYSCYGLELYLELFCHMIHCLLVDICSDDMMHYYTCISNILQNLNKFVKNNINIWFLFFDFRPSYFHSFYRVSMREVVIRVTHIPRQRCAKVLLTMLVTKLSPVQLQATGEGNIAPAKRGKRAQFLLITNLIKIFMPSQKNSLSQQNYYIAKLLYLPTVIIHSLYSAIKF